MENIYIANPNSFTSPSLSVARQLPDHTLRNPLCPIISNQQPLAMVNQLPTPPTSTYHNAVEARAFPGTVTTTPSRPGADGLDWLLKRGPTNSRRSNDFYKQLSGCVSRTQKQMNIGQMRDELFGVAVSESMLSFNKIRWPGSSPLDPQNRDHRGAVAKIFGRHIRNKKYNLKRKEGSIHRSTTGAQLTITGEAGVDQSIGEQKSSDAVEVFGLEKESDIPKLNLATNDFVLIVDENSTALAAAVVVHPFLTNGDELDFDFVTVRILQSISDISIAGDIIDVAVSAIVYIPKNIGAFANDLTFSDDKSRCLRKHDCRLNVGSLVLLDLKDLYRNDWPLVGKIKNYNKDADKLTVEWLWVTDESASNPAQLAIDGEFAPWCPKPNATVMEQTVAASSHYFCRFQLQNGKLPLCAKMACQKIVDLDS